jgi:cytochrome c oxidase cbb3-type subunit II
MRWMRWAALAASLSPSGCSFRDRDLPGPYRRLEVPAERLASRETLNEGRVLYRLRCVLCHGELGDGQGVRARDLAPAPRSFAAPDWQARTDARHLYFAIAEGRRGTAMPSWKPTLNPSEIWSLVAYVRTLAPRPSGVPDSDAARPPVPAPPLRDR